MLLYPAALAGLLALAAPIAIHILAKRRAERIPFPTLRFVQPGRLASVRRHVLEDAALLAVRLAILAAAVVALAGPLLVTAARKAEWNARTQVAVVEEREAFSRADLAPGLRRAIASLDAAPPGRREIVVRSTFPVGSITAADVAAVPASVGLRFERTGTLPPARSVDLPAVRTDRGVLRRTITLDRATTVRDGELVAAPAAETSNDTLPAVLAERVLAPVQGRRVRIVAAGSPDASRLGPIHEAWMADALAFVLRDADLRAETEAATKNGRAVSASGVDAADDGALTLVSPLPRDSFAYALLERAALNAIGDHRLPVDAETLAIPDAQLNAWSRAAGPAPPPRLETVERDDRRWLWIGVLTLLVLEWRIRHV